ncbi:MAG: hypothetical protein JWQ96_293 [Segetibacter sp.]|nr:hypothetical protein [Segetibacter sp.]
MVTTTILVPVKKLLCSARKNGQQLILVPYFKKAVTLIIVGIIFSIAVTAQQKIYNYNVLYKGNNIGKMTMTHNQNGDEMSIDAISNIQMRMLMSINIKITEKSLYKQDKLMYSSVYREMNGKEKANRQTKWVNNGYQNTKEGKTVAFNKPGIDYNLVRLYSKEPVGIQYVYSDNFQQFLTIEKTGSHTYKIELPDGNYNTYYFKNGICNKVAVNSTFFNIQMLLVE